MKNILIINSSIDYTVDYIISKYKDVVFFILNVDMIQHYNIHISEFGWEIINN